MSASFRSYLPSEVCDVGYGKLSRIKGIMLTLLDQ